MTKQEKQEKREMRINMVCLERKRNSLKNGIHVLSHAECERLGNLLQTLVIELDNSILAIRSEMES